MKDFFSRALLMLADHVESPEDVRLRLKKAEEENARGFRILHEYKKNAVERRREEAKTEAKKLQQKKRSSPSPRF